MPFCCYGFVHVSRFSRHPQGIKWEIKENDLQQVAAAVQEEKEARRKGKRHRGRELV
jgi:hypothetical protein